MENIFNEKYNDWHYYLSLDHDLLLSDPLLAIISESQLFGEQVRSRRLEKDRRQDPVSLIRNLTELHPSNNPVVHIQQKEFQRFHHFLSRKCSIKQLLSMMLLKI